MMGWVLQKGSSTMHILTRIRGNTIRDNTCDSTMDIRQTWTAPFYCIPNCSEIWARFLSLALSKLRLCSANHRPGYWSNLPCDWPSIAWAYSEEETENGPWSSIKWDVFLHCSARGCLWSDLASNPFITSMADYARQLTQLMLVYSKILFLKNTSWIIIVLVCCHKMSKPVK